MAAAGKVKVGVYGCGGRVGRRLCALMATGSVPNVELVAALHQEGHAAVGSPLKDVVGDVPAECGVTVQTLRTSNVFEIADVIVDFSVVDATAELCRTVSALPSGTKLRGLVIGTTGLNDSQKEAVAAAAAVVPVIHASNYSLGVNLLFKLAGEVAKSLGEDFNIEIVEGHHNQKVDSPSGTAIKIAEEICEATDRDYSKDVVHGRQGQVGKRLPREIGMHAVRMGGVIGDHTVHYGSQFERLELTHRAENRDVFAAGALHACAWLGKTRKPAGMYLMRDVLELP